MKFLIIMLFISLASEIALANNTQFCNQFEQAFIQEINKHRAKLKLKPLELNQESCLIMKKHVGEASRFDLTELDNNPQLRKKVAHQNIDLRRQDLDKVVKSQGKYRTNGGEISYLGFYPSYDNRNNLSATQSAKEALRQFLDSQGHRTIIEGSYNEGSMIGLASTFKDGRIIISAYFIGVA